MASPRTRRVLKDLRVEENNNVGDLNFCINLVNFIAEHYWQQYTCIRFRPASNVVLIIRNGSASHMVYGFA